jgi:hydroxymethylpyrimidine kinase/phosphomethylpyrimidine kinase
VGLVDRRGPPERAIYDSDPVQTSQIESGDEGAEAAAGGPTTGAAGGPTTGGDAGPAGSVTVAVVGGVDPGGGAGLLRDVLTARALGARALAVGTAWTEQGDGLHRVEARAPGALREAVQRAVAAGPGAFKVGMVADVASAAAVREGLGGYAGPVVVDPVLRTSRGGALYAGETGALLALLRRATLVTPNAPEAEALTGVPARDPAGAALAGRALRALGAAAVLVKGGHLGGADGPIVDTLVTADGTRPFVHARLPGGDVRGTGCALATALAVALARGSPLLAAVESATAWLATARARAVTVGVGGGAERHLP